MARRKRKQVQATLAQAAEESHRNASDFFGWASVHPAQVGMAIRAHESGDFAASMPLFEKACRCDYRIRTATGKRYRAVAKLRWEIQTTDGSDEARQQKKLLERFYDTLVTTSVERRDEKASISALIMRVMSAINFGYAAAEIRWIPDFFEGAPTYRAAVETVPLRFFEARERELRIVTSIDEQDGQSLLPDAWLVAVAPDDPLIFPTIFLYLLRMTPLQDWAATIEKYGRPIVYGETSAEYNSPEWTQFMAALRKLAAGATMAVNPGAELKVLPIAQNGSMPHKELIDMLDRATFALWRGGDLSTMSRGSDSAGSNPQSEEMDDIVALDAEFIEDTFETRLTQPFLRRVFGEAVEPKAWFSLVREDAERARQAREGVEKVHELGLPVAKSHVYEVFGVPAPAEGDDILPGKTAGAVDMSTTLENSAKADLALDPATEALLAKGEIETFKSVLAAAEKAAQGDDSTAKTKMRALLKRFSALARTVLGNNAEAQALAKAVKGAKQ